MSWPFRLTATTILAGFSALVWGGSIEKQLTNEAMAGAQPSLFHADPAHLWNRLHRHFTVRTAPSGREHGFDSLDPLFWSDTQYLLMGEPHQKALRLLDEFLRLRGERLIPDPLKRALLQRDLWAVFDWSAGAVGLKDHHPAARAALRAKLAHVLWRLALPEEQIHAVPDNYRQAVASGKYATDYDPSLRGRPFLPPDLFDPHGPWVRLTPYRGPTAPSHVPTFSGRSVFHVFLRLPGGRKATLDYLAKLWHFPNPWSNPDLPQFPPGTQVALARRLVLFDANGKLIDTALTESLQIRVFREVPPGWLSGASFRAQDFFEFELSRELLLAEVAGGLRPVTQDKGRLRIFGSHGLDMIAGCVMKENMESCPTALSCENCHAASGVHSLQSQDALFPPRLQYCDPLEGDPRFGVPYLESSVTLNWKGTHYTWGLLNALRPQPRPVKR